MKNTAIFALLGMLVLSMTFSSVYAAHHEMLSPRQQMANGVAAEDVVCKEGLQLMVRSSGNAICVKETSVSKFTDSGLATIIDTSMGDEIKHEDTMMEEETMEKEMVSDDVMMEEKEMAADDTMVAEDSAVMETSEMTIAGIDVSMAASVEGSDDAPITIIEFGDYQCPKCQEWYANEKPTIAADYIDTGIAKLYFVDFTFLGDDSISAAQAAHCAGDQEMYWEYHEVLYTDQGGINDGWASVDNLKQFAVDVELDSVAFDECLDSDKYIDRVSHNTSVGASQGVEGTPAFFVVGSDGTTETINGPQPSSVFATVIDSLNQ